LTYTPHFAGYISSHGHNSLNHQSFGIPNISGYMSEYTSGFLSGYMSKNNGKDMLAFYFAGGITSPFQELGFVGRLFFAQFGEISPCL
jgi:hypothetical protein